MTVKENFERLEAITGQDRANIETVVGSPSSVSVLPNGKRIATWCDQTGSITLQFDGNLCECITDQGTDEDDP